MNIKTYSEMSELQSFIERFNYLKLDGQVGIETFGFDRYLNQALYQSSEWRRTRNNVIIRDGGCDLGIKDRPIYGKIIIHHINPITERDIEKRNPDIFNMDYLISTSVETHNALHYSDESILVKEPTERKRGDTTLW